MKLLLILFLASLTCGSTEYDHYFLNCGACGNTSGTWDGRNWFSDHNSTFSDDFSSTVSAQTTTLNVSNLFSTTHVFISNFTYHFPVSPGPKFIRLFFFPSDYSTPTGSISTTNAYVTVHVNSGDHHLLRNFSAYHSSITTSKYHIKKEFYVHIIDSILQLTFFPSSPTSYAFINGIEVVSVPDNLYVRPATLPRYVAQPEAEFVIGSLTPLEMAYRVNVGGKEDISPSEDSGGMYRRWVNDDPYLIGNFNGVSGTYDNSTDIKYTQETPTGSAPNDVYASFRSMGMASNDVRFRVNLTWGFEVDLGFYYQVRLHWCEVATSMKAAKYRVFDVYIAGQIADKAVDIFALVGGFTPVFKDYLVYMNVGDDAGTSGSTGVLQLALHPNTKTKPRYYDVLLNGLEIFKMNSSDHNKAVAIDAAKPSKRPKFIYVIIGGSVGGFILVSIATFVLVFRRMNAVKHSRTSTNKTKGSDMPTDDVCHQFSLAQIKLATNNFNEELIIGYGGFGNVYRAMLNEEKVAIKRSNPSSKQGAHEFKTEIATLSNIRHFHLVSLIGYCDENGEMILVYDYMEHGTLRDHLYNTTEAPLSWNLRLSICLGAAKGLHYLHAGVAQMIIHRDVKSTNILLDENWVPKVSDFGLSKLGPIGGDLHVSTGVKGSFGYMDPEYYMLQRLTEKSDVYSFGVVLFEVLCGRAAVDPTLPWEQVSLVMWARSFQQRGEIEEIVDPNIKGEVAPACLRRIGKIAERCVREHRTQRPTMADVVWSLESALKLQRQSDLLSNGNIVDDNGVPLILSGSTSFGELQLSLSSTEVSTSHGRSSGN